MESNNIRLHLYERYIKGYKINDPAYTELIQYLKEELTPYIKYPKQFGKNLKDLIGPYRPISQGAYLDIIKYYLHKRKAKVTPFEILKTIYTIT